MSTPGTNLLSVVIGDSDGLIAILHEEDNNFQIAKKTVARLVQNDIQVIFPLTTIVETVTTLKRKLDKPKLASRVVGQITKGELAIETIDTELLGTALTIFEPSGPKQNTLFDAIVAACANKYKTNVIFSFDGWYRKLGFKLATDFASFER